MPFTVYRSCFEGKSDGHDNDRNRGGPTPHWIAADQRECRTLSSVLKGGNRTVCGCAEQHDEQKAREETAHEIPPTVLKGWKSGIGCGPRAGPPTSNGLPTSSTFLE